VKAKCVVGRGLQSKQDLTCVRREGSGAGSQKGVVVENGGGWGGGVCVRGL